MPNNIIGESFKPYVKAQIETRQKKLKFGDRDNDLLKYINNRTSFIRLSSGVNVTADKAKELGVSNFSGNALAQSSILFSARKYTNFVQTNSIKDWEGEFTRGVGYTLPNPSYGYTPGVALTDSISSDYGLIPPAGIISANIRPLSQGSLREATVQIACHSLPQFKIIEALYLRLGYSMLLEWGHTLWYDNKGALHTDLPEWIHGGFINGSFNQDGILENLEQQRAYTCGNYDGFFGRVVNFSWNFRPDGGYDVTLNMRAIGDVIESLKVNINAPSAASGSTSATSSPNTEPPVVANKNKSTLHQILYAIKRELDVQKDNGGYLDGFNSGGRTTLSTSDIINITKNNSTYDLGKANYKDPNEIWDKANNILTYQEGILAEFFSITTDPDESDSGGMFYYIKLGTLLRIIESFLLKYDTSKEKNGSYSPLFYIDHDFDTNICLTIPRQMSLDPHICLLPPSEFSVSSGSGASASSSKQYIKYVYTSRGTGLTEDGYLEKEISTVDESQIDPSRVVDSIQDNVEDGKIDEVIITWAQGTGNPVVDREGSALFREGLQRIYYQPVDAPIESEYTFVQDSSGKVTGGGKNQSNLSKINPLFRVDNYPFLGKFMHIHVNLDYIASILSNNIDNEGKISILKLLQDIASGISKATGEINDFSVTYDDVKNIFSFRDNNIPPNGHKYLNQIKPELDIDIIPTKFNVNLLKSSDGSFVKDLSIKSELDNNFATMITAGAQSNGNRIGENSTALNKLNVGFEDRIIPFKSSWVDETAQASGSAEKTKSPDQIYREQLISYVRLRNAIDAGTVTGEDISNNTQAVVDMYKYHLGYSTQLGEIPGASFIPLNLQLTVDGLSGPRLFETYTINDEILPINYQNNIKFIIRGITHNIDVNGWTTTLESFSAPRRDKLTPYTPLVNPNAGGGGGGKSGGAKCSTFKDFPDISWTVPKIGVEVTEKNPLVKARIKAGYKNGDSSGLTRISDVNSVVIRTNEEPLLINEAAIAFNKWAGEISSNGFCFTVSSVFRTFAEQQAVKASKGDAAATPGSSPHGWGIAIDISELWGIVGGSIDPIVNAEGRQNPAYKYIASIAAKHGWYNPYRLADGAGMDEIWHFEYWGGSTTTSSTPTQTQRPATANLTTTQTITNRNIAAEKGYPTMLTDSALAKFAAAGWPEKDSPKYNAVLASN